MSAYADVPCTWVREVIPDDGEVKRLKVENAKLRELCVDYDKVLDIAIKGYVGIDKPLLIGANQTALRSRMYKLGIEVDDG